MGPKTESAQAESSTKKGTHKSRQDKRAKARVGAHQEATLAQKLSEVDFDSITTTTEYGTKLLSSLTETTQITLAAETTHTLKLNAYEGLRKEYGNPEDADMTDGKSIARATLVQMAINEANEAGAKVIEGRTKLDFIRNELKKLVDSKTEDDEVLVKMLEDISLE